MQSQKLNELNQFLKSGSVITDREKELTESFLKGGITSNETVVDLVSEDMTCFLFEAVIRPSDKALVLHLKHLPPKLRNGRFFSFASSFIRDRIGSFESLDASFIGEVDSANKLNSLDLIFTKYYPALMGDMEFIKQHTFKIGSELNDLLVSKLNEYVVKSKN